MKILLPNFVEYGGMQQYLSQLANSMAESERVTVVSSYWGKSSLFSENVKVIFIPLRVDRIIPRIQGYIQLRKLAKRLDPDVVHDTDPSNYWSAIAKPFLKDWPLVITLHDPIPHSGMAFPFWRFIHKKSVSWAERVIVHGMNARRNAISLGASPSQVVVIPHGAYTFFDHKKTWITERPNSILFFGAMRPNKGIDRLASIAELVEKEIHDIKVIVAGSSQHTSRFIEKKRVEKSLDELRQNRKFEVHDEYIPDADVETYFRRASVVLLPYYDATQSGVIAIAYSFARPVVSTRVGDLEELVENGKTGFLADPTSNEDIADKVVRVLQDDSLRRRMGENAYRKVKEELSWDKIAKKTIEVYREAIRKESCK